MRLQLLEHRELVLAVGVDGVDEVVGGQLALGDAPAQVGERHVVRRRHALVVLVDDQPGVRVAGQPRLISARVRVGRAVVDDDQLVDDAGQLLEHLGHGGLLVVRRHDGDAPVGDGPLGGRLGPDRSVVAAGTPVPSTAVIPLHPPG